MQYGRETHNMVSVYNISTNFFFLVNISSVFITEKQKQNKH